MKLAIPCRRRILALPAFFTMVAILFAPSALTQDDVVRRLDELTRRLEALDRESAAILTEIEKLRLTIGTTAGTEDPDLLSVEPLTPQREETTAAVEPPRSIGDVEVVQNPSTTPSSRIFNPDISIIGNVVSHLGGDNPEERDSIALEEAELSIQAYIDPYAKAKFYIGYSDEEVAVEEGFAEFIALPWDLTAKVGKMKASFGKFNPMHFHTWSTIDAPLVSETFFGEEGLADSGVSVTKLFPSVESVVLRATAEVFRGDVENVFEPETSSDLFYLGRISAYRDLTEDSNIELGGSFARGTLPEVGGSSEYAGVDLTYRWKPLGRSIYRSFFARGELMLNDREGADETALGGYLQADWQLARRWIVGGRYDYVELPDEPSITDKGASLMLTFRPSEFSLIRGQFRRTDYGAGETANEFLLQLQFGIGAHGVHPF
jgi:hypothetical protein